MRCWTLLLEFCAQTRPRFTAVLPQYVRSIINLPVYRS